MLFLGRDGGKSRPLSEAKGRMGYTSNAFLMLCRSSVD
jgi:hypothetical protein